MGTAHSKTYVGSFGLRGSSVTNLHGRRSWLVAGTDQNNHCDYPLRKSYRRPSNKHRERRRRLRRAWLCYKGRLPPPAPSDGQLDSSVPTPWLDGPQGRSAVFLHERPVPQSQSPSNSGEVEAEGSSTGALNVDCAEDHQEFRPRPWQVSAYSQKGGPLCMAYATCLEYMEEDVIAALIHHPMPNEGLALIYRSCCTLPLPVEPTLEPSADVLGYVFPGTFFKVLDIRAHIAQTSYLLRLKTAEGWLTGASLYMVRLPQPARGSTCRTAHEEIGTVKFRHRIPDFVHVSAGVANRQQAWGPSSGQARVKGSSPDSIPIAVDGDEEGEGFVEPDDAISTAWGTVYACRSTRFLSFQECARLTEERMSYNSLGKLVPASSIHKLEETLKEATSSHLSNVGSSGGGPTSRFSRTHSINSDSSRIVTRISIRAGGLNPLEHSFVLFRAVGARAIPVSATPHLGSHIVGRILSGQVFPVLDACLVSCAPSCGSLEGSDDCMIAGLGTSGVGESDKLQPPAVARHFGKNARRSSVHLTSNRRVHLRVCTDEGWVTLDEQLERVDECEIAYDRPVLYEIVADGYLVNVRPALEIEGQVRRTLPPSTLVEVYERKVNAEGLVRLRLVDGWINERRKSSGETGFLFATRTADRRRETLLRHLTAVGLLLPALCSNDNRIRTAAASWVAANAAQSAIACSALMEAVDTAIVKSALRPCTCCYCKKHQGDRVCFNAECPSSICSTNSPRRRGSCLVASREVAPCANEFAECSAVSTPRCAGGIAATDGPRQCITDSSGLHSLKPFAAKDVLRDSAVIRFSGALGSALHTSGPRVGHDEGNNTFALVGAGWATATAPPPARGGECISGRCHRGQCFFEGMESMIEASDDYGGGTENQEKHAGPRISLFSLVKVASALLGELEGQPMNRSQRSNAQEILLEVVGRQSGDVEEAGGPVRSFSTPCTFTESYSIGLNWDKSHRQHRRSLIRTMDAKVEATGEGRIIRRCTTKMTHTSPLHPQAHALRCFSSLELSMGRELNCENARVVLSPSDVLYQFCVAAVYSSLAEHRESVPPYAVYRPPVGSFVPPSSYASVPVGISQQPGMLQSYRPYLVMKDGKLSLGSPTRFNSFSFHQPPIFVIHKIERICNGLLVRRYLHERSMLLLMNSEGGCNLDEAIPNPILKVQVHPTQATLNEYFLFHGCTEERAGLIALAGFDFRRGGENGGKLFGIGTYFSPHASKADLYTRPNDVLAKASGPFATTAVTFPGSLPAVPLIHARVTKPVGAPTSSALLTSIPSSMGTGGNPGERARQNTSKTCGHLRFGRGGWLPYGRGNANAAVMAARNSASPKTPDGAPKKDKEKGRFRAVCAKLTRQGSGANRSRSKDFSASGQALKNQKQSNSLAASFHQRVDTTGGKTQQAGTRGIHSSVLSSTPQPVKRCLLLARVCLGEVYKTLSPMPDARMPPNKPNSATAKLAYDSVMAECRTRGGIVDGVEFVVFERAQALPEFIITYSHAAHCQCAECHRQAPH